MAVTVGTSTTNYQSGTQSNESFAHNNDGDILYLAIAFDNANVTTFTSVQYNSVAMTEVAKIESGRSIYIYRLINPTAGSNTVFIDYDGNQSAVNYVAVSASGAHQTTPETGTGSSSGTGTAPTIASITSTASDLVMGFGYLNNLTIAAVTEGAGQTIIDSVGANGVLWASEKAGAASSQSLTWTTTSQTYGVVGLSIAPASSQTVTQTDTTPEDGVVQTVNSTGLTVAYTAFSLSGKDILADISNTDPTTATTYTVDVSATESSEGMPRIGETSTLSVTATGGTATTDVVIQPKTGWSVVTLAGTLSKGVDDFLTLADSTLGITTAVGDIVYYSSARGESINAQGDYLGGTTLPFQSTEFVIQQGGSATTTATSVGGAFYPFGQGGGSNIPKTKFRRFPWQPWNPL